MQIERKPPTNGSDPHRLALVPRDPAEAITFMIKAYGEYPDEARIAAYLDVLDDCEAGEIWQAAKTWMREPHQRSAKPGELFAVIVKAREAVLAEVPADTTAPKVRCLHVEYGKPRLAQDVHERHWRCPAWFPLEPGQPYCPAHRGRYHPGAPASDAEIDDVMTEAVRANPDRVFVRQVMAQRAMRLAEGTPPRLALLETLIAVIGTSMPEEAVGDEAAVQRRKQAMLDAARRAGVLAPFTGDV